MTLDSSAYCFCVAVEQVSNKSIRVARFNVVWFERCARKIFEVKGEDYVCVAGNGGSEYMTVIRIRQHNSFDEMFISCHLPIPHVRIH